MADSNTELRFGVSALSTKYRDISEPDELLVHENNGKMYYKREDGQIVTFDERDYTRETLANAIKSSNVSINTSDSHYIIYNTVDIGAKFKMGSSSMDEKDSSSVLKTISPERGFWIRVRGNNTTSVAVDLALMQYAIHHPDDTDPEIIVKIHVKDNTNYEYDIEAPVKYNTLSWIDVSYPDIAEVVTSFEVQITGMSFPKISSAFANLSLTMSEKLKELNDGNTNFEPDMLDLITYSTTISDSVIYDGSYNTTLKVIMPVKSFTEEMTMGPIPFILSSEKPSIPCIWAKIIP